MTDHVYKHLHLTGTSTKSIEDATERAIARASRTVRNMRWFNLVETRGQIEDDRITHWQVTIEVGFTLED